MIPGRPLALGMTLSVLSLVVLLPIAAIVATAFGTAPLAALAVALSPRALAAFGVSFGTSVAASLFDLVAGTALAALIVRRPDRLTRAMSSVIDVPFALPTAVTGITLATLYGPHGWLGAPLLKFGIPVAYTPLGIVLALAFVGLPFVVRTMEPVIVNLPRELGEAARSLGAERVVVWRRVTFPLLAPALASAFALALARTLGEYGSVIFIAGNMPSRTEIAPLLLVTRLEQYDNAGAAMIAVVSLLASFAMLLALNGLQRTIIRSRALA